MVLIHCSRLALLLLMTSGFALLWAGTAGAASQAPPPAGDQRARVFLDCGDEREQPDDCFSEYLRERIGFVDFVRQPQDADVLVIPTIQETGGGGREVVLRFIGQGQFAGQDRELRTVSGPADTESTRRELVRRTVVIGLLGYAALDGVPPSVDVAGGAAAASQAPQPGRDPWNFWVFSVEANGSFDADAQSREHESELVLSADRVTKAWKVSFGGEVNQNVERFDLDEERPLEVVRRERNIDWFVAKSLGAHWSAGVRGRVDSSTYDNTRLSVRAAPAVEFSVFPYDQYATRQFRIQYDAGPERVRYYELTLFGKLRELLWRHELSAVLDQRQPWGSLRAGFSLSQYLHDRSKYRLESEGRVNVRLLRGLSVNFFGDASRIHDQLSLPVRGATEEEVLLRVRELQSNFEVRFEFGVTYSFGSIFNNVINPRFDD